MPSSSPLRHALAALAVAALVSACEPADRLPTAIQPAADLGTAGGSAQLSLTAGATLRQTRETWTLGKTGSLSGTTVTWTITATRVVTANGLLRVEGQLGLTNSGAGPATLGNVVVNLQKRVNNKWVTLASDVADATAGDAATSARVHAAASSEGQGTFTENGASGPLSFRDAADNTPFSLVPQVTIDAGESQGLLYSAAFDNTHAALQLAPGTLIRAELIVTFGNATVNGNSTANLDINGNGVIDPDEARVRSVASRLGLTVPGLVDGTVPVLTDAVGDLSTTGDVTFSNAQFTLSATSGTVTATVDGGASGGTITNCAHLTSTDQSVDLQACSTVDVAAAPPDCTPGALGCGWDPGDMLTFTQTVWGDPGSAAAATLQTNFNSQYPNDLSVGGTNTLTLTQAGAVFALLPAIGTAGSLSASLQDPQTTSAGEFAGEVVALQLNVDLSSLLGNSVDFGGLTICNFTSLPSLNGQTVDQFLATANYILGGGSAAFGASTANSVARNLNNAFANGSPSAFAQANLVNAPSCGWQPGDMETGSQGVWGDDTNAIADLLVTNFNSLYPGDLVVGGTNTIHFTNAAAVLDYLPAAGGPSTLTSPLIIDPLSTSAGELGGEVTALKLNTDFSALLGNSFSLGGLLICNFAAVPALNGQTVSQFLATANHILGGGSAAFGPSTANSVARLINNAFVGGAPSTFAQNNLVAGACP